jgi:chromosome segregation ATPase
MSSNSNGDLTDRIKRKHQEAQERRAMLALQREEVGRAIDRLHSQRRTLEGAIAQADGEVKALESILQGG